jgi:hypothetical protein
MAEPNIVIQGTPNPNAAKFTVDRTLIEGRAGVSYFDADTAAENALAKRLFAIDGVESILIAEDFVTVTKSSSAAWEDLVPEVENAIKEALS